ncbi:hypothetical protein IX315_001913 [Porphyromonas levii]|nr:hypothetical protein [Porphyromonas levii]
MFLFDTSPEAFYNTSHKLDNTKSANFLCYLVYGKYYTYVTSVTEAMGLENISEVGCSSLVITGSLKKDVCCNHNASRYSVLQIQIFQN